MNSSEDTTGRQNMVSNVLAGWCAPVVYMIAGFIMPRMIDRRLGASLLGVWDFSWSFTAYFTFVQGGIVSSINRYVALYRGKNDFQSVNRTLSSSIGVLAAVAAIIMALAVILVYFLGGLRGAALGPYLSDARWVVLILGAEIAVQAFFSLYAGILTGFHRWEIHNVITAVSYTATVLGMIAALLEGGGLKALALIHFGGELVAGLTRRYYAYRICPTLKLRWSEATWETSTELIKFGGKSWGPGVFDLVTNQTTSVVIAVGLSPAALAVFSRSRNVVRYSRDLVMKIAVVLVSSVSALHARDNHREIQELIIKASRYSAFLTFPITMLLVLAGGPLLQVWMGQRYAQDGIVATLAIGSTFAVMQIPAQAVLAGLNRHGRLALGGIVSNTLTIAALAYIFYAKLGLWAVALSLTVPSLLVNAIYGPIQTCRRTGLRMRHYIYRAFWIPFIQTLPFGVCLIAARWIFRGHPVPMLLVGGTVGGLILVPIYWRNVLPPSLKAKVVARFRSKKPIAAGMTNPSVKTLEPTL